MNASTVLLALAGILLLMLGFSGRYKAIFAAAFPSLAGGSSGGGSTSTGAPAGQPAAPPQLGGDTSTSSPAAAVAPTHLPGTGALSFTSSGASFG